MTWFEPLCVKRCIQLCHNIDLPDIKSWLFQLGGRDWITSEVFLNGPIPASFCLFSFFSHYNFNNTNWKSIDGVLEIQTWGRRMVGTELWRLPQKFEAISASKWRSIQRGRLRLDSTSEVLHPFNNCEDTVGDSNLYFQLTSFSVYNAYLLQIGHIDVFAISRDLGIH